jgi:hypothetical protein
MNDDLFDYSDMGEAWVHFTKCARGYFARLIQQKKRTDPKITLKVKTLKHPDYAARLMYVLSFFSENELDTKRNHPSEFDLDWAMLMAKPSAVSSAKHTLKQLMKIGMIEEIKDDDDDFRFEPGGDTNPTTEFDFDQ